MGARPSQKSLTSQKLLSKEKKEEIWLSPMTKAPTPTEMPKGQSGNTNNATKKSKFSIKSGVENYWYYTLNPNVMRVNACDVRFVVCVPTLNWRCAKSNVNSTNDFSCFKKTLLLNFNTKERKIKWMIINTNRSLVSKRYTQWKSPIKNSAIFH